MHGKRPEIIAVILLCFFTFTYMSTSTVKQIDNIEQLTFSNTAEWDEYYVALRNERTRYPESLFKDIVLSKPHQNDSAETLFELALLHSATNDRTPATLDEINAEQKLETTMIGNISVASYMNSQRFPYTYELLKDSFHDITVLMLRQKNEFDRVRPSELDNTLTVAIPIPGHPAYPSGHSTQMHYLAYVLSELAPGRREAFIAKARQIAKNREIAGLHYPSDSAAGVILAQQFFDIMMQNERFQTLLAAAKEEWATNPELSQAPTNP